MNKKTLAYQMAIALVALLAIGAVVNAFSGTIMNVENFYETEKIGEEATIGAIAGPDVYGDFRVHGRFLQGGNMLATSTSNATETMPASDLINYSGYDLTPGDVALTLTLPATSTIVGFLEAGECTNFRIRNLDTTAATSTTIAAGTGMDLMENENGDVVIEGGHEARLWICRENGTNMTVYVDEYIDAD